MNCQKVKINFNSEKHKLVGQLYYPVSVKNPPGVIFLHGAAKNNPGKNIFEPWQKYLAENGFSSLAFHSRGVGKSQGQFEDGSLKNRLIDATNAFNFFTNSGHVNPNQIGIIGNSMGGHIATRLVEKLPRIKTVILLAAAAYHQQAEDQKLNQTFTNIIRQKQSLINSPAFQALKNFAGQVLIIYPENDIVIPEEVKKGYKQTLKDPNQYLIIPQVDHNLLLKRNILEEQANQSLYSISLNFLKESTK